MKNILFALLLFPLLMQPLFAQNQAATDRAEAGCGPAKIEFNVKTDKHQHSEAQPEAGKALVYVFENERRDPGALPVLSVTARIGLDGNWVGADHGKSHLSFPVDPGDHSVCVSWQSSVIWHSRLAAAASLTAEAGKVYYFETTVEQRTHYEPAIRIREIDPAEAKLLLASSSLSTSKPKK